MHPLWSNLDFNTIFCSAPLIKALPWSVRLQLPCIHSIKKISHTVSIKKKKTHGDQGQFVGAALQGKVVMIDDVISAGTTVRETLEMFANLEVTLAGIVIAFDRQEKGQKIFPLFKKFLRNIKFRFIVL